MKITLLRHFEVIESHQGKYNGHIDIPLSQKGIKEAQIFAKELQKEDFSMIYCSDLLRARETLEALQREESIIFTSRLREKSWGIHEGKSFEEIQKSGIEYRSFSQWINALDGEPYQTYIRRLKSYFCEVVLQESAKSILIITHAGVIKTLVSLVEGISLKESFSRPLLYGESLSLEIKKELFCP